MADERDIFGSTGGRQFQRQGSVLNRAGGSMWTLVRQCYDLFMSPANSFLLHKSTGNFVVL